MRNVGVRARLVLVAIGVAWSLPAEATPQRPEIMLINGGVYCLPVDGLRYVPPLSLWRPWRDTRTRLGASMLGTDCYRGYVGIWEVHEDHLYLRGLHGWTDRTRDVKLDMKTIFPEQLKDSRVRADWFDGEAAVTHVFQYDLDGGWRSLHFVKGKVVFPPTMRDLGVEDPVRAKPPRGGSVPPAPKDHERRMPDGSPNRRTPDIFILDGVVYYLPAEYSVRAFPARAMWRDPEIKPRLSQRPDGGNSFGFVRGYRAVWEIYEGSLYILAIEAWMEGKKAHLKALFPEQYRNGRVVLG